MMSHSHNHCGCNHELAYCGHCDIVYCKKCGREWGHYQYWYTPQCTYPTVYTRQAAQNAGNLTAHVHEGGK